MALLGLDQVKKLIQDKKLLENIGDRDLKSPEGVGIDLRLGAAFQISEGGAFIEADTKDGQGRRKGVKTEQIFQFDPNQETQDILTIKPSEYYLIQTYEQVNTPENLMPIIYPRSSLFRAGLLLLNSKTDPGYQGKLIMGLTNLGPFPVDIQLGARICNMVFFQIEGETVRYRGQHQGGRVTPEKIEQQV